ncbi:MAG: hypothetical protein JW904_06195 [Spirochaetales bacterium]|nr:hypothetical protein [Spirochaetales bacterium]
MQSSIFINKKQAEEAIIREMIMAFNSDESLTLTGGFLFQSTTHNHELHIGCLPWYLNNERVYHYDIPMKYTDRFTLFGSIIKGGIVNILFKPVSPRLSVQDISRYQNNIVAFAEFLISNGFTNSGILDEVTQSMLISTQLWKTAPKTISDLLHTQT